MLEPVKVMIDEQSKLTLKQLQDVFAELLAPLKNLEKSSGDEDSQRLQQIESELHRLSTHLDDAVDDLSRKIAAIADAQAEVFSKVAAVASLQEKLLSKEAPDAGVSAKK